MATAKQSEEPQKKLSKKELIDKVREARAEKEMSVPIMLMESDLYDWNPGARVVLLVIALARRRKELEEGKYPDMPAVYRNDMIGWCNLAQWRIALRAGKSESQVQRDIKMFIKDGVIEPRRWEDDNGTKHAMYKINEDVVKDHQRPAQKKNVERPSRYKEPHKPRQHKGLFSAQNQPPRVVPEVAEMDEE
jgi:hypothetical protein